MPDGDTESPPLVHRCPICRAHRRLADFKRHAGRDYGYDLSACKPCAAERQRIRVAEVVYKIDRRTALAIYKSPCAICGRTPDDAVIVVDHSHTTGRVRGALCSQCNSALGLLQDSADLLISAVSYLTKSADYRLIS